MRRRQRRSLLRDLARQRMELLYREAVEAARRGELDYAASLGQLIRRLSMETRVRPPRWIKRGLCKRCGVPLIPGLTARVRLVSQGGMSYKVIRCLRCGWIHRYPYKKGGRGHAGREPEGEGEEGPPRRSGRDNREEGLHRGGPKGDRQEA